MRTVFDCETEIIQLTDKLDRKRQLVRELGATINELSEALDNAMYQIKELTAELEALRQ